MYPSDGNIQIPVKAPQRLITEFSGLDGSYWLVGATTLRLTSAIALSRHSPASIGVVLISRM